MVTEESVRRNFTRLVEEGFDPAQPHLWQHMVCGSDPSQLRLFVERLAELGFAVVDPEPRLWPDRDTYVMNVEIKRVHTPESLLGSCAQLASLAQEYSVVCDSYVVFWET
jgi:hypothetical protein